MEPTHELTLEESVKEVMQTLPPIIRDYLSRGEHSQVAEHLTSTYKLHVDQAGVLEREIMLLLMGIDTPDEFAEALVEEAKLDRETINSITRDVNEQIFVPLRKKMQEGGAVASTPVARATPAPVVERPSYGTPAPQSVAPAVPKRSVEVVTPRAYVAEPPPFSINKLSSGVYSIINHVEGGRMMLEDHEEPHIEVRPPARPIPPPPNLPGAMPPQPRMPEVPNPQQWASNTSPRPVVPPPPRPTAPRPPAPAYSNDPYREPIEGN